MKCKLVDVFAKSKLNGNGLTIFYDYGDISHDEMLSWTQEMRQFESIFVQSKKGKHIAKIYTMDEELDFAGHPLLGLAYHLHEEFGSDEIYKWVVQLNKGEVQLSSYWRDGEFIASMRQGQPKFLYTLTRSEEDALYSALNIPKNKEVKFGAEVISTGLPYVILPVIGNLDEIKFNVPDLTPLIEPLGAKFLYILDIKKIEGRTWDNYGSVEDIATGSAAGPVAAFLFKNGLTENDSIILNQGRFLGRPSQILIKMYVRNSTLVDIEVSGNVVKVANIKLEE
ncbi:MAG: PhzF family phenazine biosynthesis protein [Leptolyngbya sp. SIO1D8]|nr:PhzF family phenazine biosynthesis protein [Leptolyngbya sp. SIO1D8]